jgi:hypothetical protein
MFPFRTNTTNRCQRENRLPDLQDIVIFFEQTRSEVTYTWEL